MADRPISQLPIVSTGYTGGSIPIVLAGVTSRILVSTLLSGYVNTVVATAPLNVVSSGGGSVQTLSLTGVVPVGNGGTGSTTQNWVDLTSNQSVAGNKTFSGPVATTANIISGSGTAYGFLTAGDLAVSRSVSTGVIWVGGSTSAGYFSYGQPYSGAFTTNSPLAVPTIQGQTQGYVAPCFTNAGAAVNSTWHNVFGTVNAVGASTSVTLTNSAIFTSAASFVCLVIDQATGAIATLTAQTASSFTFTSVNAHSYTYTLMGY